MRPGIQHPSSRSSRAFRPATLAVVAILGLGGLGATGCGGSSDDDEQSAKQMIELQQAREAGRKEAVEEARSEKLAEDAAKLRAEVAKLRKSGSTKSKPASSGSSGGGSSSGGGGGSSSSGGGTKSCGEGITANSVTSCPFARAVREAYYSSGQSSSVSAYSTATGQAYAMDCSGSGATTCRGGNGAQVTFP